MFVGNFSPRSADVIKQTTCVRLIEAFTSNKRLYALSPSPLICTRQNQVITEDALMLANQVLKLIFAFKVETLYSIAN